jgi:hypothetical protein
MIALLSGTVAVRRAAHVVVQCGGVGYRVAVSAETLRHVPAVGKDVVLHTHLIVRDDALSLYGFATEEERELFLMLTSCSRRWQPGTPAGSAPPPGSGSAPPNGSSSSFERRSAPPFLSTPRSAWRVKRIHARSRGMG